MPRRDSLGQTLKVALILCLVCSFLVSAAAVLLRPRQEANKERERKKNILIAADGLYDPSRHTERQVPELYDRYVTEKLVDLVETHWYAEAPVEDYDQRAAVRDSQLSVRIPADNDIASVRRKEKYSYVYLVEKEGELDQIVLPIRGYGLWSTLWGFISLDAQGLKQGPEQVVVRGLTYYEHEETPGLGGEVDNPAWRARWKGKPVFNENWNVLLEVVKNPDEPAEVDALSGATITSNGVTNMMQYWLGPNGFGPYLKNLHEELNRTQ